MRSRSLSRNSYCFGLAKAYHVNNVARNDPRDGKDHFVFPFSVQNVIACLRFSVALDEIWSSTEALQVCLSTVASCNTSLKPYHLFM